MEEKAERAVEGVARRWEEARGKGAVEEMAAILEECHTQAMEKRVPQTKVHWRSKPWFKEAVKEKRSNLAKQRRWVRESQQQEDHLEWKRLRNDYFHTIHRKKRKQWDEYIQKVEGREMWGIWKMVSTKRTSRTPTLTHPTTGQTVHTFTQLHHTQDIPAHIPLSNNMERT